MGRRPGNSARTQSVQPMALAPRFTRRLGTGRWDRATSCEVVARLTAVAAAAFSRARAHPDNQDPGYPRRSLGPSSGHRVPRRPPSKISAPATPEPLSAYAWASPLARFIGMASTVSHGAVPVVERNNARRSLPIKQESEIEHMADLEMNQEEKVIFEHRVHVRIDPVLNVRLYRQPFGDRHAIG
jgi:hypothetical protein